MPTEQSYGHNKDNELDNSPLEGPAAIVPLRGEEEAEGDQRWLLSEPRLTSRASTFPRIPYERFVSP